MDSSLSFAASPLAAARRASATAVSSRPTSRGWAPLVCFLIAITALLVPSAALALEVPPLAGRRIHDAAGLLSPEKEAELEARLSAYEKTTGHQLAVLTIPSLEGEPLEDYTMRVVEAWKLGRKDRDDGILLFVASQDRKLRIEVGYGLEGDLPDVVAGRIEREIIAPAFRQSDYDGGIGRAVEAIVAATGGEGTPLPPPPPVRERRSPELGPFGLLVLFALLFLFGGGFRGGRRGRSLGHAPMFFGGFGGRGGGGGGGGFGGGGGGGFRGGGGGFGGGGASGSW